jgi:hypothetical protein
MLMAHRSRWPDDRVARELEAYFAEQAFERWPTYRTFVRDCRKRLHEARRTEPLGAGARGCTHPAPRRHAPQRRSAPRRSARAHARAPSGALPDDVLVATARATRNPRIGQTHRGRRALGPRTAHAPSPRTRWTDDLIEQELRRATAGTTDWPTRAAFDAAGTRGLRRAIYEGRGSEYWAERVGLVMARRSRRRVI